MASAEELAIVERHEKSLKMKYQPHNNECYRYYYQKLNVKDLGISTPPRLVGLNSVLGWASAAVDCITERIKFTGLYSPTNDERIEKLNRLFRANDVEVRQDASTKNARITGCSFISTTPGDPEKGEAAVIFRPESPNEMTGDYNHRTGLMDNAFKCVNMGNHSLGTLWLPNVTIQLVKRENSNIWEEIDRDEHNLGEVTVAPDFNEQDTQYPMGRSEITPSLRGHVDSGMRILLGTEVAREFFGQPLRTVTGVTQEEMSDSDGKPLNPWDLIASKFIVLPGSGGDGETAATMTQLPASNPENIMNLLEPTARLAAREIGLDPSYFGFSSINPTSAEAMNFSDAKLLNKVYKRQPYVGKAWKLAARHAQLLMFGEVMEGWEDVQPVFVRAEAHSPAAAADRISKLFSSKVFEQELPDFIYVELGFSPVEILQLKQWLRNSQGESLVKQLLAQNANGAEVIPPAPTPETNSVTDVTPQAGE